jgi:hypothetical protein
MNKTVDEIYYLPALFILKIPVKALNSRGRILLAIHGSPFPEQKLAKNALQIPKRPEELCCRICALQFLPRSEPTEIPEIIMR